MKLEVQMETRNVELRRYLDAYFSEEFNQMALDAARLSARELEHFDEDTDGCQLRRVRMVPDVSLPGPVRRLLKGHEIAYYEITRYDPRTQTARFDIESPAGDVVRVGGEVRFSETETGVVLRFEGDVKVRVFGLGRLIEQIIVRQVQERYAAIEAVLQRHMDGASA